MLESLYGPQSQIEKRAFKSFVRLANPDFNCFEIRSAQDVTAVDGGVTFDRSYPGSPIDKRTDHMPVTAVDSEGNFQ
jgi:hypothetical protein